MLISHPIQANVAFICQSSPKLYSSKILQQTQKIWEIEQQHKILFNDPIFSLDQYDGNHFFGHPSEYRFFLAQLKEPNLFAQLNIQILAVSGLLLCAEGVVLGLRNKNLTQNPEQWELVPSGSVSCKNLKIGEPIDYLSQLYIELKEELGISQSVINTIRPFVVIEDTENHVFDIGIKLETNLSMESIRRAFEKNANTNQEYTKLRVIQKNNLSNFINSQNVAPTSKFLLTQMIIRAGDLFDSIRGRSNSEW